MPYIIDRVAILLEEERVVEMYEHSRNNLVVGTRRNKDLIEIDLDKEATRLIVAQNQTEGMEAKCGIETIPGLDGFLLCPSQDSISLVCIKEGIM